MIPCTHCNSKYQFRPGDMVSHLNAHAKVWIEQLGTDEKVSKLCLHAFSSTKDHDLWWKKLKEADRKLLNDIKLIEEPTILNAHSINFLNALEPGPSRMLWKNILLMLAEQYKVDICTGVEVKKSSCTVTFAHPVMLHVDLSHKLEDLSKHGFLLTIDEVFKMSFSKNLMRFDAGLKAFIVEPVYIGITVKSIEFKEDSAKITINKKLFDRSEEVPLDDIFEAIQDDTIVVEEKTTPKEELERLVDEWNVKHNQHLYTELTPLKEMHFNEHSMDFLESLPNQNMRAIWKDQLLLLAHKYDKDCCTGFVEKKGVFTLTFDREMQMHIDVGDTYVNSNDEAVVPSGIVLTLGKKFAYTLEGNTIHIMSPYKVSFIEPMRFSLSVVGLVFTNSGLRLELKKLGIPFSFLLNYSQLSSYMRKATIVDSGLDPKKYLKIFKDQRAMIEKNPEL